MGLVFISYRRTDASGFAKRMADELKAYFGSDAVFFDQTAAEPGKEWPAAIRHALEAARAILVVIEPHWLATHDASSRRRIDVEDDWVRQEIVSALRRRRSAEPVDVIPILVGETPMPRPEDLDEVIGPLCLVQALRVPDTGSPADFAELKSQLVRRRFQPRVLAPVRTPRYVQPPPQLTEDEEAEFVVQWPEWNIVETSDPHATGGFRRELHRVYEFPSFKHAFQFMTDVVARGIEPSNHHPRWENTINRVAVWLTTFNLDYKPSVRDVRLATVCETVWQEFRSTMAREGM